MRNLRTLFPGGVQEYLWACKPILYLQCFGDVRVGQISKAALSNPEALGEDLWEMQAVRGTETGGEEELKEAVDVQGNP